MDEGGLAHDASRQHAPGHRNRHRLGLEALLRPGVRITEIGLQLPRAVLGPEAIRKRRSLLAQRSQLGAPLGDQAILVMLFVVGLFGLVGHDPESWLSTANERE